MLCMCAALCKSRGDPTSLEADLWVCCSFGSIFLVLGLYCSQREPRTTHKPLMQTVRQNPSFLIGGLFCVLFFWSRFQLCQQVLIFMNGLFQEIRDVTIVLTDIRVIGSSHAVQLKIPHHAQVFALSRQMFSVKVLTLRKIFLNERHIYIQSWFVTHQPEGLHKSTRRR